MDFSLANVKKLTKGISKIFNKGMKDEAKKEYLDIASEVNTKSHTVDYTWLGELPSMREWIDERVFKALKDYVYTISKKDWEASISVKRDDFIFDNLGIVKVKINQLIHSITKHYNSMVFGLIPLNGVCFDGKKFFDTHMLGDKEYTNITDAKLTEDALFAAIAFMQGIEDAEGETLGIEPSLLCVSPDLLKTAKKILGSKVIEGSDNVAMDMVKLKVVRQMTTGTWCLLDTTQPLKPFILQITKVGKLEEDSKDMFAKKKVYYGVDTMDNAGYGFWQMAYFSSGDAGDAPAE